jgi:hypothetical protein
MLDRVASKSKVQKWILQSKETWNTQEAIILNFYFSASFKFVSLNSGRNGFITLAPERRKFVRGPERPHPQDVRHRGHPEVELGQEAQVRLNLGTDVHELTLEANAGCG